MTIEEAWSILLDLGVHEQCLSLIADINGYSLGTMRDILYAHTGYNDFDQLVDE